MTDITPNWLIKIAGAKTAAHLFYDLKIDTQEALATSNPDDLFNKSRESLKNKSSYINYLIGYKTFQALIEKAKDIDCLPRKRIKSIFDAKKKKFGPTHFLFKDENEFYEWDKLKPQICYYCKTEQYKITELVLAGIFPSKKFKKRGRNLEIERKCSQPEEKNVYSSENCELACTFCQNDKSDVINAELYIKYFSEPRKRFIDDLYEAHINSKL